MKSTNSLTSYFNLFYRCHVLGDETTWKKKCIDENKDYETTVWAEPGDPMDITSILDSKEFIKLKEEFEKYGVGYSGKMPLLTSDEMRCLFAECTNGKDLRDYATFIGKNNDFWNKRMPEHTGLKVKVPGFKLRNEILVNYVKKESRMCMGNERNGGTCPCARDIINTVPRRLSVSDSLPVCDYEKLSICIRTDNLYKNSFSILIMEYTKVRRGSDRKYVL